MSFQKRVEAAVELVRAWAAVHFRTEQATSEPRIQEEPAPMADDVLKGEPLTVISILDCERLSAAIGSGLKNPPVDFIPIPPTQSDATLGNAVDQFFAAKVFPACLPFADGLKKLLFVIDVHIKLGDTGKRTSQGGVELLEHLRLTPELGEVTKAHVLLLSFETAQGLLRSRPKNLCVLSPGVTLHRLPDAMQLITDVKRLARLSGQRLDGRATHFRDIIRCKLPAETERAYVHSYLNRAGAVKFLAEFAGDVVPENHPVFVRFRDLERTDLNWKRLACVWPDIVPGIRTNSTETSQFVSRAREHSYVCIDDDHQWGWSLGLYSGLFGKILADSEYRALCEQDVSSTPDSKLCTIKTLEGAELFIGQKKSEMEKTLALWSELYESLAAENGRKSELEIQADKLRNSLNRCKTEHQQASQMLDTCVQNEKVALAKLLSTLRAFSPIAEQFHLELETDPSGTAGTAVQLLERHQATIQDVSRDLGAHSTARTSRLRAQERVAKAKQELEKATDESSALQPLLSETAIRCSDLAHRSREAERKLGEIFPYSVIFLDLRLRPLEDEGCLPEELAGVTVLRNIERSLPHVPVIVMSASQKAEISEVVRNAGGDAYWIKGSSSGQELQTAILQSLAKAELASLWIKIGQVKVKKELACEAWNGAAFVPKKLRKDNQKRADVEELLEESFWLLWRTVRPEIDRKEPVGGAYDHVIRNLGIVQEIRYEGVGSASEYDRAWSKAASQDGVFRKRRNELSHAEGIGRGASLEEAYKYLSFTLGMLLRL